MSLILSPYSFIDEQRLRDRVRPTGSGEDNLADRLVAACNASASWMNRRTSRNLKARNYRVAVSVTLASNAASADVQLTLASTATLKVGDDFLGTGVAVGSQVLSIDSATLCTLTRPLDAAITVPATFTAGGKPVYQDAIADIETAGRRVQFWDPTIGTQEIWMPEYPVLAGNIYEVAWLDGQGSATAVDLTAARYDEMTGRLLIAYDIVPRGDLKLRLQFRGGYEQPSATAVGHWDDWENLTRIQLRAAEVFFADDVALRGRSTQATFGAASSSTPNFDMPSDIENALRPYWRVSQ